MTEAQPVFLQPDPVDVEFSPIFFEALKICFELLWRAFNSFCYSACWALQVFGCFWGEGWVGFCCLASCGRWFRSTLQNKVVCGSSRCLHSLKSTSGFGRRTVTTCFCLIPAGKFSSDSRRKKPHRFGRKRVKIWLENGSNWLRNLHVSEKWRFIVSTIMTLPFWWKYWRPKRENREKKNASQFNFLSCFFMYYVSLKSFYISAEL